MTRSWANSTPEEILADLRKLAEASPSMYDPATGRARDETAAPRTCSKKAYPSERAADKARRYFSAAKRSKMYPHRCRVCGAWHLSSSKGLR